MKKLNKKKTLHYDIRNTRKWGKCLLKDIDDNRLNNLIPYFAQRRLKGKYGGWFHYMYVVSKQERMFRNIHGITVPISIKVNDSQKVIKKFKFLK